jgi:mono/diheme cytochrome c family protein
MPQWLGHALGPTLLLVAFTAAMPQSSAQAANALTLGTAAQVDRGEAAYRAQCASCHRANLSGTERVPALAGDTFTARWQSLSVGELLRRIQTTMPQSAPHSLSDAQYLDILSFILSSNGVSQGADELLLLTDDRLSSRLSLFL